MPTNGSATSGDIAAAFGLGRAVRELQPVQMSQFAAWRLDTEDGSFLVKRLWPGPDSPLRPELEAAMDFERLVISSGLDTATPIPPTVPDFGWAAHVEGRGVWRAYEWLDRSDAPAAQPNDRWIGETLAHLHRLRPQGADFQPEWRWIGAYSEQTWNAWINRAKDLRKPWTALVEERLSLLVPFARRLVDLYDGASDHVFSHRDFGPWNVIPSPRGPVLIDWEGAGPTKGSWETGRAVRAFGGDDLGRMRRLLHAYEVAGGVVACPPEDLLIGFMTDPLAGLTERIRIAIGDLPEQEANPVWLDLSTIDADIVKHLNAFPETVRRYSELGRAVMQG